MLGLKVQDLLSQTAWLYLSLIHTARNGISGFGGGMRWQVWAGSRCNGLGEQIVEKPCLIVHFTYNSKIKLKTFKAATVKH
jgi:hypothetical protein